jgi:site-specific recombinase XerD
MEQTDFARILTRYLADFLPGQRNLSSNTIKSYRDTFKQLLLYLREEHGIRPECITFKDVTTDKIKGFMAWLEKTRNVSINTRNQRLAAIHSFYRYAQAECPDILYESQKILGVPFKKRHYSTIDYLTKDILKFLLEQPDISTKKGRRDLVMMATLYDTGARVQELIDLKVTDVRLTKPVTITLTGKGNKKRCVPLMDKTHNVLQAYMEENHLLENGRQQSPLFHNSRYQSFSRPGITYVLNKYFKMAKQNHPEAVFPAAIHPHMMRHTKALHLLESGVNLIYIRDLLGHVSVTTTEIYLRADTELKRAALESAYPEVVSKDIPVWTEDTDLLHWLKEFCR